VHDLAVECMRPYSTREPVNRQLWVRSEREAPEPETEKNSLEPILLSADRIPDSLLARVESRDAALWVRRLRGLHPDRSTLVRFLSLPWSLVICEDYDEQILSELQAADSLDGVMVRRRGLVQILDRDPSRVELPQRCLPIFLLNGREPKKEQGTFEGRLRRLTMLEHLRRTTVREILVISPDEDPIPPDLNELWSTGFKCFLTIVSSNENAKITTANWTTQNQAVATLVSTTADVALADLLSQYELSFPDRRRIVRIRDVKGNFQKFDVTAADEPERPILDYYTLIEERDLHLLNPEELNKQELIEFFQDSTSSWRPYAAGLPWRREADALLSLQNFMRRLDTDGSEENRIVYIVSESGAGGTTLARSMAFACAREGYPVLLAKQVPFVLDPLPVSNFLTRVHASLESSRTDGNIARTGAAEGSANAVTRLYETPWLIVFDTIHAQYREAELVQFRREMEKAGRPVCLLVVTGPEVGAALINKRVSVQLAELNHIITVEDARALGQHLNRFLAWHGRERPESQWNHFYEQQKVRYMDGVAAFWVALSFWIQGQFDLNESMQEWIYRLFQQQSDTDLRLALLRIAAFSTERLPLPERLLPPSTQGWPLSYRLAESRHALAALGLTALSSDGEKYWALIHDILGRLLINGLYYDTKTRTELGFGAASDPNHLRFLILREISQDGAFGEKPYKPLGEDFATTIFKIDPDHGHAAFLNIWRQVLGALEGMPAPLRNTSRLFRHHTAISRRRVAKLEESLYDISLSDKSDLLLAAIRDLTYALTQIPFSPGSESNLNLLNSLANAYSDLADVAGRMGKDREAVLKIQALANQTTKAAYQESPTNPFVIETYVKNLLRSAKDNPERTCEDCVEILGIIFSVLASDDPGYRAPQLNGLAEQAFDLLLQQIPTAVGVRDPQNAVDVLVDAWRVLGENDQLRSGSLADIPEESRERALKILEHPAGRGNLQALRLRYNLLCSGKPFAFTEQIEILDQLDARRSSTPPQLRLEYAILLFQNGRNLEGDKIFRDLRKLWKESEHIVEIPERLRWLRSADGRSLQIVHARVQVDYGARIMARVQEFGSIPVPLRPEEHGFRELKIGSAFACHVSFGPNGPFLRPLTAGPRA
jgi:hypothetical protein